MIRFRTLFWIAACGFALAGLGLLLGLRSYHVFTQEDLVAIVRCEVAPKDASYAFILEFTPVHRGVRGSTRKFPMVGDQWTIEGNILKWHPGFNLLGFKTCYKLTRLSSRYLKIEDEIHRPKLAHELNGSTDFFWLLLYRYGRWFPFVEAVYGNATYVIAQPVSRWGVYVTLSGYLVKPLQ